MMESENFDNTIDHRFFSQAECFEYAEEKKIKHPFFYAFDDDVSKKTFGVLPLPLFIQQYNTIPNENKNFYEILHQDYPIKEAYDIEILKEKFDDIFIDTPFNSNSLFQHFTDLHDDFTKSINANDPLFIITDSSTSTKLSLHILNEKNVFKNFTDNELYMNKFKHFIKNLDLEIYPICQCIDFSIVSKNKQMRIIGSSKKDQDRPLKPPVWNEYSYSRSSQIHKFLITDTRNIKKKDYFKIPKEWKKLKVIVRQSLVRKPIQKRKVVELENIPEGSQEQLEYLLENIPDFLIEEYHAWVRLVFCLLKLGVSEEKIHEISSMSEKYNFDSCNRVINSYDSERCNMTLNTLKAWVGCSVSNYEKSPTNRDYEDDFYFMDFFRKHHKKEYKSNADMLANVLPDIPKIFSFLHSKNVLVVKENKTSLFSLKRSYNVLCTIQHATEDGEDKLYSFGEFFSIFDKNFYHYDRMVFKPENHNLQKDELNTWVGFEAKPVDTIDMSKIQLFLNHIKEVWASNNDVFYNYIITWLAHIIQKPWIKTRIAILIQGDQGSGKGVICDFLMRHLFGMALSEQTIGIDKLVQRFNSCVSSKLFINANELVAISDAFNNVFDRLKPLITDDFIQVEQKGIEPFTIDNNANFLLTTNHNHTIKLEGGDRRYATFSCDNKYTKDYDYFNKLTESLNQECANHLFTYLKQYNITIDLRRIPETELRRDMMELSMPNPQRFLRETRENMEEVHCDISNADKLTSPTHLFNLYLAWCENAREKPFSLKVFGSMIKGKIEQGNKRFNGPMKRYYDLKTINV